MKHLISIVFLTLSLSAFADGNSIKLVLDQPEVEGLGRDLSLKGYSLFQITDLYAKQGVVPRCPCENMEMKFVKSSGSSQMERTFNVTTSGFGSSLKVKIEEIK